MIPPINTIDDWLSRSESLLDVPGDVQKVVKWRGNSEPNQSPLSVVYVHGYTATRHETAPLSDEVAHALDANLFYTRLKGHGLDGEALRDVTLEDWLADTRQALDIGKRIGRRQIVIASSTGATFVSLLAIQGGLDDSVAAIVFLSPNYGPADRRAELITKPTGVALGKMLLGGSRSNEPHNEGHRKYWTNESPVESLVPMMEGVQKLRSALETNEIRVPALTLYCPDDQVVMADFVEQNASRFTHAQSKLVPVSGVEDPNCHLIAGDIMSPGTTPLVRDEIVAFVNTVLSSR